jgi:hypothetical protein
MAPGRFATDLTEPGNPGRWSPPPRRQRKSSLETQEFDGGRDAAVSNLDDVNALRQYSLTGDP